MTDREQTRRDASKLPKWAQMELGRLQRDLDSANEKLAAGPENSVVFAHPYRDNPTPLGDADVLFLIEDGNGLRQKVRVHLTDPRTLDINGGDGIEILPRASNSVEIRLSRR